MNDICKKIVLSGLQFQKNATVRIGCGDISSIGLENLLISASDGNKSGKSFINSREYGEVEAVKARYKFSNTYFCIFFFF